MLFFGGGGLGLVGWVRLRYGGLEVSERDGDGGVERFFWGCWGRG